MTNGEGATTAPSGRRGRPPLDPETREARIFDALEQVVSEDGLRMTTMSRIARAAGMSKRTLYTLYVGRDALFEAWVRRVRASFVRPLPAEARTLPLAERLRVLLWHEARHCLSDRRLAVLRAMIAEAPGHPDLARAFCREGFLAVRGIVADELRLAAQAGDIMIGDADTAATILVDMVYQSPLDRLLNPDATYPDTEHTDQRLSMAIAIFLQGTIPDAHPQ
ncbi:TetR/AcrR family transcriptional regulator [Roseospira marina]|nr:TetR/AcrR family transcriptional regulator [Roseospira marina]MBB4313121.1 AcrR family transcriptional regulator [Roseospira marina]MBB5086138.1 AcrR family transcriptional regulator [Roseospira marina]